MNSARIRPFVDLEARRELEQYVDLFDPVPRPEPDLYIQQISFESSLAIELDGDVDAWCPHVQCANRRDKREGRGEEDQFR